MSGKVKLSDVAELAGVSRAAAGKVLNNCAGGIRVSKNTRKKIIAAARELDYHGNMAAAMLAGKKSSLIGVLIDSHSEFRNLKLLAELERAATSRGLRLLISYTHDNISQMRENCHEFEQYNVCGTVCICHDYYDFKDEVISLFQDRKNIVYMEPPFFTGASFVKTDNEPAMKELFGILKRAGKKRIALVHGDTKSYSEKEIVRCYKAALEHNGIEFRPELCHAMKIQYTRNNVIERAETAIEKLIKPFRPDVLYCDDSEIASSIQNRLQYEKIISIPDELILIGGNNAPHFNYVFPRIHSLDPRYDLMAEALLDALESGGNGCFAAIPSELPEELMNFKG